MYTPASCAALEDALKQVADGDVVQIASGLDCMSAAAFTIARGVHATIEGMGAGATLRGGDHRAWESVDSGEIVFRNLTFREAVTPYGGGGLMELTGDVTPTLDHVRFLDGHETTGPGGGLELISSATSGTALIEDSTFGDGTRANANTTTSFAGGAAITMLYATNLVIRNTKFLGNRADESSSSDAYAGGLWITTDQGSAVLDHVTIEGNVLAGGHDASHGGGAWISVAKAVITDSVVRNNRIEPPDDATVAEAGGLLLFGHSIALRDTLVEDNSILSGPPEMGAYEGGLFVGGPMTVTNVRVVNNSLPSTVGPNEGTGAGLFAYDCDSRATLRLRNLVVAGNATPASSQGALRLGCGDGLVTVRASHLTVSGNTAGGDSAGVWDTARTRLTMRNSIVAGNIGGRALTVHNARIAFSDVCFAGGVFPGHGNICRPPLLANATFGDVRETLRSPTIDRGSNRAVPSGLTTDLLGARRIVDGNGDGVARADMGAVERHR